MTTKKDMILAAMSEHRYRTAAEIAKRAGIEPTSVSGLLSRMYYRGRVDRDTSTPFRYILRAHQLPLKRSLSGADVSVLKALHERKTLSRRDHVDGCNCLGRYLSELETKGAAERVEPGVYRATPKGRAFVESLDKPTPKQQPLPVPRDTAPTPEPKRDPVPWHIPIQPPTVVERPQYTSAALIVAAAAIIIAIIVTGCIQ